MFAKELNGGKTLRKSWIGVRKFFTPKHNSRNLLWGGSAH